MYFINTTNNGLFNAPYIDYLRFLTGFLVAWAVCSDFLIAIPSCWPRVSSTAVK